MMAKFWSIVLTLSALAGLGAIVYFIMHFATSAAIGLPMCYWFVPIFGAAGGAVGGILRNENKIVLCRLDGPEPSASTEGTSDLGNRGGTDPELVGRKSETPRTDSVVEPNTARNDARSTEGITPPRVVLGIIADICVGLGGACAIAFLFGNTLRINSTDPLAGIVLIGLSFLAGTFGKDVVEFAKVKLLSEAKQEVKKEVKAQVKDQVRYEVKDQANVAAAKRVAPSAAIAFAYAATQMNNRGVLAEIPKALEMAEQALQYDQRSVHAYVEKGRSLKLLGNVEGALATIDEGLKLEPHDVRLRYNRACYMTLLKKSNNEILNDLKEACEAAPQLCELARRDADLDGLRLQNSFRELMLSVLRRALHERTDETLETAVLRFSKACYMSLLKGNKEEILTELRQALSVSPKLVDKAHTDPDLDWVRKMPEFRELLGTTA